MNQTANKPPRHPAPHLLSHPGAESCVLLLAPAFPASGMVIPDYAEILQLQPPTAEPPEL